MGPKKIKTVTLKRDKYDRIVPISRWSAKNYYIYSVFAGKYIETDTVGDVFLETEDRKLLQKWEFVPDTEQAFYIKNVVSGLFFTSDLVCNLSCNVQNFSSYQKWKFFETSEPETYVIVNLATESEFDLTLNEGLILNEEKNSENIIKSKMFRIYPLNIPKK